MLDNIKQIKELLHFEAPGDFYMLYVFKRKKDQPEDEKDNHQSVRIKNGQPNQKGLFDSVVGQIKTQEKRWIVDIDTKDEGVLTKITSLVNSLRPEGDKVIATIPTKNGYHLITARFDVLGFQQMMNLQGDIPDIQKKNPTLLYYPNSLDNV